MLDTKLRHIRRKPRFCSAIFSSNTEIVAKRRSPLFIPNQRQEAHRPLNPGPPITWTLEGYKSYEIHIQTANRRLQVFKPTVATIEILDDPRRVLAQINGKPIQILCVIMFLWLLRLMAAGSNVEV